MSKKRKFNDDIQNNLFYLGGGTFGKVYKYNKNNFKNIGFPVCVKILNKLPNEEISNLKYDIIKEISILRYLMKYKKLKNIDYKIAPLPGPFNSYSFLMELGKPITKDIKIWYNSIPELIDLVLNKLKLYEIIHGDISPDNIIILNDKICLCDWYSALPYGKISNVSTKSRFQGPIIKVACDISEKISTSSKFI